VREGWSSPLGIYRSHRESEGRLTTVARALSIYAKICFPRRVDELLKPDRHATIARVMQKIWPGAFGCYGHRAIHDVQFATAQRRGVRGAREIQGISTALL
jgi:hypothetical protein